jgi:hypothetical protein
MEVLAGLFTISFALQCAATVTTFLAMWRMGDRSLSGPLWGIASQVPWFALVFHDGLWGLLPINLAMAFIHTRNFIKWKRERVS